MTKHIRIENADTSTYKVKVTIQEKKRDAETGKMLDEWVDVKTIDLNHPTAMLTEYLTNTRRFIVEENGV
jgi:maltodextrin utilization protein YvdJ